jgi:hypothetical protein
MSPKLSPVRPDSGARHGRNDTRWNQRRTQADSGVFNDTWWTFVKRLITRRSRVQIPPPPPLHQVRSPAPAGLRWFLLCLTGCVQATSSPARTSRGSASMTCATRTPRCSSKPVSRSRSSANAWATPTQASRWRPTNTCSPACNKKQRGPSRRSWTQAARSAASSGSAGVVSTGIGPAIRAQSTHRRPVTGSHPQEAGASSRTQRPRRFHGNVTAEAYP